jgi:hypothetical protein
LVGSLELPKCRIIICTRVIWLPSSLSLCLISFFCLFALAKFSCYIE